MYRSAIPTRYLNSRLKYPNPNTRCVNRPLKTETKVGSLTAKKLKIGIQNITRASACVLRESRTTDDIQSSNNDILGAQEQTAASSVENSSMLRRKVSTTRL